MENHKNRSGIPQCCRISGKHEKIKYNDNGASENRSIFQLFSITYIYIPHQATPLFVHFLMIASVGVYAIFGAVVMRKLEAKTVEDVTAVVHRRHAEQHDDIGV